MIGSSTDNPKPKPRWRFRLSTILLLVVIVALGLTLLVQQQDVMHLERELQQMRRMVMQQEDRAHLLESQNRRQMDLVNGYSDRNNHLQAELNRARAEFETRE
ncbi:hypothetical protein BH23PLA1_BH23PLA1_12840 [soil metagenome]